MTDWFTADYRLSECWSKAKSNKRSVLLMPPPSSSLLLLLMHQPTTTRESGHMRVHEIKRTKPPLVDPPSGPLTAG